MVIVCDGKVRTIVHKNEEHPNEPIVLSGLRFSPAARKLAWTGDRKLFVLDLGLDGAEPVWQTLPGIGKAIAWSPDSRELAVGGIFRDIFAWDVSTNEKRSIGDCGASTQTLEYLASGDRLISGHSDGAVRFWNLSNNAMTSLHFHRSDISAIAISHDQRIGVSADKDANLAVWFAQTGERIGNLRSDTQTPDSKRYFLPRAVFAEDDAKLRLAYSDPLLGIVFEEWKLSQRAAISRLGNRADDSQ